MIPEIEQKSFSEIKEFQEQKLRSLLVYLQKNSNYYQNLFEKNNIHISAIETLEDLTQIPVTTKDNLQMFNEDFFCVSREKIIDYSTTSGTLGTPVTVAMSDKDLERLAYNEAIRLLVRELQKTIPCN